MVVGHGAQGAAGARVLKEHRQHRNQQGGAESGDHVEGVDQQAAFENARQQEDRILGDADVQHLDVRAPERLPETVHEEEDADRRHEKDDVRLVDQRT